MATTTFDYQKRAYITLIKLTLITYMLIFHQEKFQAIQQHIQE